jgi:hypothetical protein
MNTSNTFYALFRYKGETIGMNEQQFKQAVADGRACRCKDCLACRTYDYWRNAVQTGAKSLVETDQ